MASAYYLPAGLGPFLTRSSNFDTLINTTPVAYGLTAPLAAAYSGLHGIYSASLVISTTPGSRTPVTVADTKIAFEDCRAEAQSLVQIMQASGLITLAYAADLGITFRDLTKTPIAAPTEIPDLSVEEVTPLATKMRLKVLGALGNAMPFGATGYQVAISVEPVVPPMDPAALTLIGVGTRRFYTHNFDGGDIGKAAYFAVRYLNAKQQTGPWSNIITTTVVGG